MLIFNSCKKEEDINNANANRDLVASFTYTLTLQTDSSILIAFQNKSTNATSYKWYFSIGDSSVAFEPILKVYKNGSYTVTLKAINGNKENTITNSITIANLDTAKNSNNYPHPTANFKVVFNIDSSNIVSFTNLSSGYTKVLWKFEDNQTSIENNPIHNFLTSNTRAVKLIVENIYKIRDSITINFNRDFGLYQLNYEYLITDVTPITYSFYLRNIYYNPNGKYGISFGENYTSTPIIITDTFNIWFNNGSTPSTRIQYYTLNNITTYQKSTDLITDEIQPILNKVLGEYTFYDRSTYSSYTTDSTIYNDTTLSINLIGDALIELKDTKLNHTFTGYLSSTSTNQFYEFRLVPNPVTGSIYEDKYMQFPKNSNTVNAFQNEKFGMVSHFSETIYRGTK